MCIRDRQKPGRHTTRKCQHGRNRKTCLLYTSEQNKAGGNYIQNRQQDAQDGGANSVSGVTPEDNAGGDGKDPFNAAIDKLFPDTK